MRVIEGTHVDLISPYPISELERAVQWFFQYSSYTGDDNSPRTPDAIRELLTQLLQINTTYGIIDRNNLAKYKHEAPLVGIISFAPQSAWNGYLHIAMGRRAWGIKNGVSLAEEGAKLAIEDVWKEYPELLRQSCLLSEKNYPARRLALRCGFKIDGVMQDFFRINGKPTDSVHLGILKNKESKDNGSTSDESNIGGRGEST